jgi:hypothetical protein
MLNRCGFVAIAGVWFVLGAGSAAHPACNAIPSLESSHAAPPALNAVSIGGTGGPNASASYKVALGRIDRIYMLPDLTRAFRIQPDGKCVDRSDVPAAGALLENLDDVAVFVALPSEAGKRVSVAAHAAKLVCDKLAAVIGPNARQSEAKDAGPRVELIGTCGKEGLRIVQDASGASALEVPVPTSDDLKALDKAGALAPVIVATRIGTKSGEDLKKLVQVASQQGCAKACGQLAQSGVGVCADSIFALTLGPGGESAYQVDPIPCAVGMSITPNDFKKQCETDTGIDPTLPSCDVQPQKLAAWADGCGGVHIPFSWTGIRGGSGPTGVNRKVAGRSGTGRKKAPDNPRVWLPGREFVGSTPVGDPQGTASTTNWRRPQIDVWYLPDSPQETGLIGVVDQDDSIVHVFPRLRASVFCDVTGDEACMGVDSSPGNVGLTCACTDRYAADCQCKPDGASFPRFFACQGGTYDGMPCTRDRHCNPGGTCTQKPFCQPKDKPWELGLGPGTGTPCWVDNDCDPVAGTQCGYSLFDVTDRKSNIGLLDFDAKIQGAGHKGRGACTGAPSNACGNGGAGGPGACSTGSGDCRGFQLKAGAKVTP